MKFLVCLFLGIAYSQAFLFSGGPAWDDLKVTWNPNPFSSYSFASMPRTTQDAVSAGFEVQYDFCKNGGPFVGTRYWTNNDPAVFLLYDVNGYIAGIQTAIDTTANKYTPSKQNDEHPLITDGTYQVLTAYFVDPAIVCNGGRSSSDYNSQGTGSGLWIQNGTKLPEDALQIPMQESDIGTTKWTQGHCFWTMGEHYWYNVRADMSCDEFYPFFVLYNKGVLNGFGFAMNTQLTSPRYEHPTVAVAGQFINPLPDCFNTDPTFATLSTLHVFMTSSPLTNFC